MIFYARSPPFTKKEFCYKSEYKITSKKHSYREWLKRQNWWKRHSVDWGIWLLFDYTITREEIPSVFVINVINCNANSGRFSMMPTPDLLDGWVLPQYFSIKMLTYFLQIRWILWTIFHNIIVFKKTATYIIDNSKIIHYKNTMIFWSWFSNFPILILTKVHAKTRFRFLVLHL